jgi:2-polyprenyl-6-methoxyphenol hydroxylase-like FAD-dependent oxidoreductase
MNYDGQTFRCSRRQVVEALAAVARSHGAEIVFSSEAMAAEVGGVLILSDGKRCPADLVIAADGVNSPVRDSLSLLLRRRLLCDGAKRLMIRRRPEERIGPGAEIGVEYWSGTRRIIFSPCNADEIYIAMSCLAADQQAKTVPIDVEAWVASFPGAEDLVRRIAADAEWDRVQWVQFQIITLRQWSAGRAAVIGDAAHAMTPNLGQGAMCAMTNALALAVALDDETDAARALRLWERRERPLTDHTQRMSSVYGAVTTWPSGLRALALKAIARIGWLNDMFYRAARHIPTGTA